MSTWAAKRSSLRGRTRILICPPFKREHAKLFSAFGVGSFSELVERERDTWLKLFFSRNVGSISKGKQPWLVAIASCFTPTVAARIFFGRRALSS